MIIEELSHKSNYKGITVRLDYDEVINLANAMYNLQTSNKRNEKFDDITFKCCIMRDLVKHGMIQSDTLNKKQK